MKDRREGLKDRRQKKGKLPESREKRIAKKDRRKFNILDVDN